MTDISKDAVERVPMYEAAQELFNEAYLEAIHAQHKFPQPNYLISKVAEEAGEVVKAAIHCAEGRDTKENVRGEIKQTIAMLIRLYVEGDQVHGLDPIVETRCPRLPPPAFADTARKLLTAYDGFLAGQDQTDAQRETANRVAVAASFGAAAYEAGMAGGNDVHALARSFLIALVNPASPDLDYLRAGQTAEGPA